MKKRESLFHLSFITKRHELDMMDAHLQSKILGEGDGSNLWSGELLGLKSIWKFIFI